MTFSGNWEPGTGNRLLTIRQAAAEISVCRNTMLAMMRDGRVSAVNIARAGACKPTWRVRADRLRQFRDEPLGPEVLAMKIREIKLEERLGLK